MLIELQIRNFKSFKDLTTISFRASKTSTLSGNLLIAPNRERFVKAMALYGPNASGKTTALDALFALGSFVTFSSQDQKPTAKIPLFEPFALDKTQAMRPCAISVEIQLGSIRYTIEVEATSDRIWKEKLTSKDCNTRPSRKTPSTVLIERLWIEGVQGYKLNLDESLGLPTTIIAATEQTPPNRLILGKLASLNSEIASHIVRWFDQDLDLYNMHRNPAVEHILLNEIVPKLQNDASFSSLLQRLVHDADIGIQELRISQEKSLEPVYSEENHGHVFKEAIRPGVSFLHQTKDGSEVIFRRDKESDGTLRFIALITAILRPGVNRRLVCIDELSASLHPDLVKRLLKIVHSRKYNPQGHQVLFTTHDTHLINPNELLRRDQVLICEKDRYGRSTATRLDTFQDNARSDANLQKQYLQGRFGGKPLFGPSLEDIEEDDEALETRP